MIHEAIKTLLAQRSTVNTAAIVPSNAPLPSPQPLPRILYTLVSGPRNYADQGASKMSTRRIQLDIFGKYLTDCEAIADRIMRSANAATNPGLDGYLGTVNSTFIQRIYFPELPTSAPGGLTSAGANTTVCRLSVDLMAAYLES